MDCQSNNKTNYFYSYVSRPPLTSQKFSCPRRGCRSSPSQPRDRGSDEKAREWRKIGCLAEERNPENCGYTLEEPLKGRLPARTIDYRNASHTQSRSRNKSNLAKKR